MDLLEDFYPSSGVSRRAAMQRQVVELARKLLPDADALREQLDEMLAGQVALGMLTDIFSYTLGFPLSLKQRLLAEWNVDRRARMLIEKLSRLAGQLEPLPATGSDEFPPRFSLN